MSFGKFEGCPSYVEYFWELSLHGTNEADIVVDDVHYSYLRIDKEDRALYPSLPANKYIVVWESEQGFVYHSFTNDIPED